MCPVCRLQHEGLDDLAGPLRLAGADWPENVAAMSDGDLRVRF